MADRVRITGVWKNDRSNGPALSGSCTRESLVKALDEIEGDKIDIAVWNNSYKEKESDPDYALYFAPAFVPQGTPDVPEGDNPF